MNKNDLKYGNVVETREGFKYLYIVNKNNSYADWLINLDKKDSYLNICSYRDDLTYDHAAFHYLDIVKVYKDYTLKELLWERKEIKLTNVERIILENIRKEYKWIARNKDGYLFAYDEKPIKAKYSWNYKYNIYDFPFDNLFQFIQWDDDEPYLIEDLLNTEDNDLFCLNLVGIKLPYPGSD